MNIDELENKMNELIELAHSIAMKDKITPDDKVKLKAVNQAEKIINYQLNRIKVEELMARIDAAENTLKAIDKEICYSR